MERRRIIIQARRLFHRSPTLQIGVLLGFWLAGEAAARLSGLPIPGGIFGLTFALGALATGGISIMSVRRGADRFLADMLLFFIPAVLAILDHREFLGVLGLKILAVIVLSTFAVMSVTALTVDLFYRWRAGNVGLAVRD